MMRHYAKALNLGDIFGGEPAEKVCPLTKQLIVEKLRELAIDKPYSIRRILEAVFADGIVDDYALLDRLEKFDKPDPTLPNDLEMNTLYDVRRMAHHVRFRSKSLGKEVHHLTEELPPIG